MAYQRHTNNKRELEKRKKLRKSETYHERLIWNILRRNKLGVKFRRQVSIGFYVTDFYCGEKKLAIEIDGSQHLENKEYDKERELYFMSLGIQTIRFWNYEVDQDIVGIRLKILKTLELRTTSP